MVFINAAQKASRRKHREAPSFFIFSAFLGDFGDLRRKNIFLKNRTMLSDDFIQNDESLPDSLRSGFVSQSARPFQL